MVQIAFQMKPGINNLIAEAAALAEALVRGRREIVRTITALVAGNPGSVGLNRMLRGRVVLGIFSDSRDNLDALQKAKWQHRDMCWARLLQRCVVESNNIVDIPEFPDLVVELRASWVPAHREDYAILLHTFADEKAGEARVRGSFQTVGHEEHAISGKDSVVAPLGQLFYTQAAATNTMKLARKRRWEEANLQLEDEEAGDNNESVAKKSKRTYQILGVMRNPRRQAAATSRRTRRVSQPQLSGASSTGPASTSFPSLKVQPPDASWAPSQTAGSGPIQPSGDSDTSLAVVLWRRRPFSPTAASSTVTPSTSSFTAEQIAQAANKWWMELSVPQWIVQRLVVMDPVLRKATVSSDGTSLYFTPGGVQNYPFLQKADGVFISRFEPWTMPKGATR